MNTPLRSTAENTGRIRIGLLLEGDSIPTWFHYSLENFLRDDRVEIVLILDTGKKSRDSSGKSLFFSVFDRIDRLFFSRGCDPLTLKSLPEGLHPVPVQHIQLRMDSEDLVISSEDARVIRKFNLALIINACGSQLRSDDPRISKLGIWSFIFGDAGRPSREPVGFREVVEKRGVTETVLLVGGVGTAQKKILKQGSWFTYPFSPARNRSYFFWAAAAMLPREIKLLYTMGIQRYGRNIQESRQISDEKNGSQKQFSNIQVFLSYMRLFGRGIREGLRRLIYREQWILMTGQGNLSKPDFATYYKLVPPARKFWADPMLIEKNSTRYIFFEEFDQRKRLGRISVTSLNYDGKWVPPQPVLEKPYHLSYPFVFEWDGKYFMIPESSEIGRIDLFECVEFPLRWEFCKTLINNVLARDTTIIQKDGLWWLFTAIAETKAQGANVELFIFSHRDLFTANWKSHPMNPVCSDIRRSRPAGRIFKKNGKFYRPSQDCSRGYGYGFDLNEIEILTASDYREKLVRSVRPDWDPKVIGTHTLDMVGSLTVIDALTRIPRVGFRNASI